jgi:YwiC-like protein
MAVTVAECSVGGLGLAEEAGLAKARSARRSALILPREHGAWGLLLVPLVTGAGVALRHGGGVFPLLLLLTVALTLFWLRTPVESLLGTSALRAQTKEERVTVGLVILGLGKVAVVALGVLLWAGRNRGLWLLGGLAGVSFAAQALLKRFGRSTRMLSEVVGTMGLALSAPAAYYVVTGKLDGTAWMLWLVNLAFAGNQIHYVQLRIHTVRVEGIGNQLARGWTFAAGQAGMAIVLAVVCLRGLMPWIAMIAFVPILFRGWLYFLRNSGPLVVRRLGWNELAQAASFCVLFIAAFFLAG